MTNNGRSKWFRTSKAIRQESILSPTLFIIIRNKVIKRIIEVLRGEINNNFNR